MNLTSNSTKLLINLDYMSIIMLWIVLFMLVAVALDGSIAPIILYVCMMATSTLLIGFFSNKDEIFFKIKLFIFFFSLYLCYTLINHYFLLTSFPNKLPFDYPDEKTLYMFSNFGLPYISGEKSFFDIFSVFKLSEMSLHVTFTAIIGYLSILIDNTSTIIAQKLLSPFLGGLLSVVLYSTLKYQFSDRIFALNATFAYSLLSAVFIYSMPLLRDIDVSLAYMIFFYLFLQKNSIGNLLLLLLVAYATVYLRVESGMVLLGLILLYVHLYVREIQSRSVKFISYIMSVLLLSFIVMLKYKMIVGKVISLDEVKVASSVAAASADSIAVKFNKLPFGISHTVKLLFGQMLPFPFFRSNVFLPYAISGIFWPFVFMMMLYVMMKKDIRVLIDEKVKYLLFTMLVILLLMSGEALTRRMMSVYPIIYISSLYAFIIIPKNKMKKIILYYLFAMISINILYYIIKI